MTLSQLTFRNTLLIGGQRDISYHDIDSNLRRAEEEGEQIEDDPIEGEKEYEMIPEPENVRPAGKLFGRSLIDDLEARKMNLRSKNRSVHGSSVWYHNLTLCLERSWATNDRQ
jgi:hypothetical protein